ncbi:MAG: dihydrofolate reductase, partial [Bifidobacteriaceae bacterium]|nr:dihydrofolate reductase [Bifidobacteriaceae bacterium]
MALIWARTTAGVIGRDGALPWRLPEDLVRFKNLTWGHAVVMGRVTWDSLPDRFRPLPGRANLVLTRQPDWLPAGAGLGRAAGGADRSPADALADRKAGAAAGGAGASRAGAASDRTADAASDRAAGAASDRTADAASDRAAG